MFLIKKIKWTIEFFRTVEFSGDSVHWWLQNLFEDSGRED